MQMSPGVFNAAFQCSKGADYMNSCIMCGHDDGYVGHPWLKEIGRRDTCEKVCMCEVCVSKKNE